MVRNSPLAAILVADVVGYSRRMKFDETGTIALVERAFARARRGSARFGGKVVKTTGDGWIALFDSVSGAVECAVVLQRLAQRTVATSELTLRISVHVGEVMLREKEYFGHALNVAVRMQALADPGGIIVSQKVVAEIERSARFRLEAMGHPLLKNIGDDLALYRLHTTTLRERPEIPGTRLRLRVLGKLMITTETGEEVVLNSANAAAMIGVLALEPDQPIAGDRLAAMLWPDRSPAQRSAALARTRRHVNARLARGMPPLIVARGTQLALNLSAAEIDLQEAVRALEEGVVPPILLSAADMPGDVLAGIGLNSPTLDAWLTVRRTIWRDRIIARLEACLERHDPDQPALRTAAEALLRLEPGHEPASMALMRHLAARGRKEAALNEFQRLSSHLRQLRTRPGEAATHLATSLRDSGSLAASRPLAGISQRVPQIAIGALDGDGLADRNAVEQFRADLIANLSRFRNWAVLDIMGVDPGSADYLLLVKQAKEGAENRLQFRLVEAGSRSIVWGEAFSLSSADWRERQSHVIGRVASALEIYISSDRLSQVVGHVPLDITNYDDWRHGEALLLQWAPQADAEAQQIFERLIRNAPTFALPYASLASIMNVRHILQPGHNRTPGDVAAGYSLAMQAVELDPMDARNHLALSWSAALAGRFDQAAVHLDLATSLNPFSPTTMISAAMGYAFFGDHNRAGAILNQALQLSPMLRSYQWCYVAAVHFLSDNPEAAEAAALRSGDKIVDNQGWLAAALVRQGRLAEARIAFDQMKSAVSRIWTGDGPCDAAAVRDWFVNAYPIRHEADRNAIAEAMSAAIAADPARRQVAPGIADGRLGAET